jgi:uncharacterized protein YktB (UPF0637 family)
MFTKKDFDIFSIPELKGRMEAIRSDIQPKFKDIGDELVEFLQDEADEEMHLHIAQHLRRSVNPPNDTWLAICNNKRGYKQHPHFQVGLFDDHVFVWLAFIYEMPNKQAVANDLLDQVKKLESLPKKFVISQDHMKKDSVKISEADVKKILNRFRDVKKAEFLVGVKIAPDSEILESRESFIKEVKNVYKKLVPFYKSTI